MADYSQYGNFTLPQVNFSANVFKPKELTFKAPNTDILQQSLKQYENRVNSANTQLAEFNKTFGILRKDLADDPETQAFIKEKYDKALAPVKEASASGNFGEAMRLGEIAGSELALDPEILDRKDNYSEYKDLVKKIQDSKASDATKQRYLKRLGDYSYKKNSAGQYGEDDWYKDVNPYGGDIPVEKINWIVAIGGAMGVAAPRTTSNEVSKSNQTTSNIGDKYGDSTQKSSMQEAINYIQNVKLDAATLKRNIETWYQSATAKDQVYNEKMDAYEASIAAKAKIDKLSGSEKTKALEDWRKDWKFLYADDRCITLKTDRQYLKAMTDQFAESAQKNDVATKNVNRQSSGYGTSGGHGRFNYETDERRRKEDADNAANSAQPGGGATLGLGNFVTSGTPYSVTIKQDGKTITYSVSPDELDKLSEEEQ